jgi:O-antigen ligase
MKTRPQPGAASGGVDLGSWAATSLLAVTLVGFHLVVDPSVYDVSQLPRLWALLATLLVAVPVVFGLPAIAQRLDAGPLRDPLVIASAAYLASCGLSLAWTVNPSAGFTDVFRTAGAFLVLCLCLLLLPLERHWRERLLQAAVVATVVAVGCGGWETLPLLGQGPPSRRALELAFLDGMMSNVNLFAGFLLLLIPWCVLAAVELPGGWRPAGAAAATAAIGLVIVLQSRAAWLALAAGGIVAGILMLRHRRLLVVPAGTQLLVAGGLGLTIVTALGLAGLAVSEGDAGDAIRSLVVSRPHQEGGPSDGGRTRVWAIAAEMIGDHPLSGVGAGNFTIRMHEYFGGEQGRSSADFADLSSDNWISPHNDFLWVFAEKGLPGIVSFLAIFGLAAAGLHRVVHGHPPPADARLAVATTASLVSYLVLSCLDFPLDRVSHQVILAVHLAVVVLLDRSMRVATAPVPPPPAWLVVPPVAAVLVLGLVYASAGVSQERAVMVARRAEHDGDWPAMRAAARRAATPWKTLDPLAVPVAFLEGVAEQRLGNLPAATACFERAVLANPNRAAILQNLGAAYAEGGRLDDAVTVFAIAADRYPDRVGLRHNLAMALADAGRFTEAIAVIEDVPEEYRTAGMEELLAWAREQARANPGPPE